MSESDAMIYPRFKWSRLLGIRPVNQSAYLALTFWVLVAVPSGLVAIGTTNAPEIFAFACALIFILSTLAFFWVVFYNISGDHSEEDHIE